jgi:hypothetical protein
MGRRPNTKPVQVEKRPRDPNSAINGWVHFERVLKSWFGVWSEPEPAEETTRRIILDAAHLQLDLTNNKQNKIRTSKYTLYNFFPKNMFEQFRKVANAFFLILVLLQISPQLEVINAGVASVPILIIILVTAAKDAVEDFRRHTSDNQVNCSATLTLKRNSPENAANIVSSFEQLGVGDAKDCEEDEEEPANVTAVPQPNSKPSEGRAKRAVAVGSERDRLSMLKQEPSPRSDTSVRSSLTGSKRNASHRSKKSPYGQGISSDDFFCGANQVATLRDTVKPSFNPYAMGSADPLPSRYDLAVDSAELRMEIASTSREELSEAEKLLIREASKRLSLHELPLPNRPGEGASFSTLSDGSEPNVAATVVPEECENAPNSRTPESTGRSVVQDLGPKLTAELPNNHSTVGLLSDSPPRSVPAATGVMFEEDDDSDFINLEPSANVGPRHGDYPDVAWAKTLWMNVQVGDFILLREDDVIPADVIILSTSEPSGLCYVETKNLDGETNLKIRKAPSETSKLCKPDTLVRFRGYVEVEPPHNNLYAFTGTFADETDIYNDDLGAPSQRRGTISALNGATASKRTHPDKSHTAEASNGPDGKNASEFVIVPVKRGVQVPININGLLLRGCVLRNTKWVIGLVVFTGYETKLMLNSGGTPSKRSMIDRKLNPYVRRQCLSVKLQMRWLACLLF